MKKNDTPEKNAPEQKIPVSKRGGLITVEELQKYEYIRTEFFSSVFKAKITLNCETVTFSAACVRLFPESEYVQILADREGQRLLAWSCDQHAKAAVKWSKFKDGKLQSRIIIARILCAKIFELMNWDTRYRYKIMAVYQKLEGHTFVLFNLDECERYIPGDGKKNPQHPLGWADTFGTSYAKFKATYETNPKKAKVVTNSKQEGTNEKSGIVPRVPTSGEMITKEYYTPDTIVSKRKKK